MVEQSNRTVSQVLGEITWLLSQSAGHKQLAIADLEWAVMPAILLNQFHIFYNEKQPIAVATWAFVSEHVEQKLLAGTETRSPLKLELKEWKCGDRLWLIDMVCPFATEDNTLGEKLVSELSKTAFRGMLFNSVKNGIKIPQPNLVEMGLWEAGHG